MSIPVYHPSKNHSTSKGGGSSSSSGGTSSSGGSSSSGGGSGHSSGGHSSGGHGGGSKKHGHKKHPVHALHDGEKPGKGKGAGGEKNPYGGKGYAAKSAHRNYAQAMALQGQIKAMKLSLSSGFKKALDQRLANIKLVAGQQDAQLVEGYNQRIGSLEEANDSNEKSAGDANQQNVANRSRERSNAIAEAMNMGAGESDVLRSSMMALRSWDSNQQDLQRAYFDSHNSLNSSLTDLNVDTKTGRLNIASQANADRDSVTSSYHDQMSETYTNLGNAYGMQGEYLGMALEQKGNKKVAKQRQRAVKASTGAFMGASKQNSTVFKNPGVGALANWEGQGPFEETNQLSKIQAAPTASERKAPEGASLRKWTT